MHASQAIAANRLGRGCVTAILLALAHSVSHSDPGSGSGAAPELGAEPTTEPAKLPGIRHIDLQKKSVDLDAEVVLREADWLEQLACLPSTREHESILVVHAKPSHIHLALLTLGLQPGSPMQWQWHDDQVTVHPPNGAPVAVSIVMQRDGGEAKIPANQWVLHQVTKQPLPDNIWLFAGSRLTASGNDDKPVYHADVNGTTISLVSFGDDLLARPTELTNKDDEAAWGPATDRIPDVGTKVIVRLEAVPLKATTKPDGETEEANDE